MGNQQQQEQLYKSKQPQPQPQQKQEELEQPSCNQPHRESDINIIMSSTFNVKNNKNENNKNKIDERLKSQNDIPSQSSSASAVPYAPPSSSSTPHKYHLNKSSDSNNSKRSVRFNLLEEPPSPLESRPVSPNDNPRKKLLKNAQESRYKYTESRYINPPPAEDRYTPEYMRDIDNCSSEGRMTLMGLGNNNRNSKNIVVNSKNNHIENIENDETVVGKRKLHKQQHKPHIKQQQQVEIPSEPHLQERNLASSTKLSEQRCNALSAPEQTLHSPNSPTGSDSLRATHRWGWEQDSDGNKKHMKKEPPKSKKSIENEPSIMERLANRLLKSGSEDMKGGSSSKSKNNKIHESKQKQQEQQENIQQQQPVKHTKQNISFIEELDFDNKQINKETNKKEEKNHDNESLPSQIETKTPHKSQRQSISRFSSSQQLLRQQSLLPNNIDRAESIRVIFFELNIEMTHMVGANNSLLRSSSRENSDYYATLQNREQFVESTTKKNRFSSTSTENNKNNNPNLNLNPNSNLNNKNNIFLENLEEDIKITTRLEENMQQGDCSNGFLSKLFTFSSLREKLKSDRQSNERTTNEEVVSKNGNK